MTTPDLESNTEKGTGKSSIFLPIDVIENILLRLPLKPLVRFKSVSKSWHAIISAHRFSRIHRRIHESLSNNLFLMWAQRFTPPQGRGWIERQRYDAPCLNRLENQEFRNESVLEIPFERGIPLCSCDGIVVLMFNSLSYDAYVLWNPSTRAYAMIKCPFRCDHLTSNHGLYYDSTTDDYKVVAIDWTHYAVYSCKSRSWVKIKPVRFTSMGGLFDPVSAVFLDGSFYWYNKLGEIVYFDVGEDELKKLPQPNDLRSSVTDEVRLTRLSERLCLYCLTGDWTRLQLWVMEKQGYSNYSWRELMNMGKGEPDLSFIWPECLTSKDDVVICLKSSDSKFVIYNHREKSFKTLEVNWRDLYKMFPYSECVYFPIQNMNLKRRRQETETGTSDKLQIGKTTRK